MKNYQEIHFETIDSTNLYIKHHYLNLADFTFVSADYQTNGKGRMDRVWKSEKGDNLLFSLLIKNQEIIKEAGYLSLVTAVSVASLLENKYKLNNVNIKWPNDIFVNDKKICGILLEGQLPEYVVIGVGLNVHQKTFLGEYNHTPTSLSIEGVKNVDIKLLKADMFDILHKNLLLSIISHHHFYEYFSKHNYLKNKEISFIYNGKHLKGKVIDVDRDFRLIIAHNEQKIILTSGEVSLIKN